MNEKRLSSSYLSSFTVLLGFKNAKSFQEALLNENVQKFGVFYVQRVIKRSQNEYY
jgi:hypothetical protein